MSSATTEIYNEVFKKRKEPLLQLPNRLPLPKLKKSYKDSLPSLDDCPCDHCSKFDICAEKKLACKKFADYVKQER